MNRICTVCKKKQFGGGINDPYLQQWFCSPDCHMVRLEEIIVAPPPIGTECQDPCPDPLPEATSLDETPTSDQSADPPAEDRTASPPSETDTPQVAEKPKRKKRTRKAKPKAE